MTDRDFSFFRLQTRPQALAHLERFARLEAEEIGLEEGWGRVLAEEIASPEDLPPFARSTMDGFAVKAKETFGASESTPALFELAGEVVMGRPAEEVLGSGQTMKVWTGGMVPPGADAVVMLEYVRQADEATVELTRAVAPGAHLIEVGQDVGRGEVVLAAGTRLRAQDLGLLAGLGVRRLKVVRRPQAAIISTGNELVASNEDPSPGCIREINSHTLRALLADLGAEPTYLGLVPDDKERLSELVSRGMAEADTVIVSGGSSVGAADWTLKTFLALDEAELLIHGVSISPGKPIILVRAGSKSLWGLPGHVAGAFVAFHLFVRPLINQRLLGQKDDPARVVKARLTRNLASAQGREDWVRARLEESGEGLSASPVLGPSGLISTLTRADGLIRVPLEAEGLFKDSLVDVHLF